MKIFILAVITFISFSSAAIHRIGNIKKISTDSIPSSIKSDSVWVESGYGWTHHTYHWIPAHWQVTKKKVTVSIPDSTQPKQTKVWIKGHREFIHNNWVWVAGRWETHTATTK